MAKRTSKETQQGCYWVIKEQWQKKRKDFGILLSQQRDQTLSLTQEEMGERIGVSHSQISRWEQGNIPQDYPTLKAIIQGYDLDLAMGRNLLYLFGIEIECKFIQYGEAVALAEELLSIIQRTFNLSAHCDDFKHFDYFALLSQRLHIMKIAPLWNRLRPLLPFLQDKPFITSSVLIVQIALLMNHYWDVQGLYEDRVSHVMLAANLAEDKGQPIAEGWLRGDGLAWPLLEICRDPIAVEPHLACASKLALQASDYNLLALVQAFQAKMHLLRGNTSAAHIALNQAFHLAGKVSLAPLARIFFFAGEVAQCEGNLRQAIHYYEEAKQASVAFTGNTYPDMIINYVRISEAYLAMGEVGRAKQLLATLCSHVLPYSLSIYEIALITFGRAKVAAAEKDWDQARIDASQAKRLLETLQLIPWLYQDVCHFLARLPL